MNQFTTEEIHAMVEGIQHWLDIISNMTEAYEETEREEFLAVALDAANKIPTMTNAMAIVLTSIAELNLDKLFNNPPPESMQFIEENAWRVSVPRESDLNIDNLNEADDAPKE